jgi:hypothetical protein
MGCESSNDEVCMNHIQVIGSHNSYKEFIEPELLHILRQRDSTAAITLDYGHIPIRDQLDRGLRVLELDVYDDPEGGRYASPMGLKTMKAYGIAPVEYDTLQMRTPGMKVLHVQDIDFRSTCALLSSCLQALKSWSDDNPAHHPVFVTINTKSDTLDDPGLTAPLPFGQEAFSRLDSQIIRELGPGRLIRPDDVRGTYDQLESAILDKGWPSLNESRGKFLFVLDEGHDKTAIYHKHHPLLEERVMFTTMSPGHPTAAVLVINDPVSDHDRIQHWVSKGYLVRTRADADTYEARNDDFYRFERALSSGAHLISTDYYIPDIRINPYYQVCFPDDRPSRLNPIFSDQLQHRKLRL